MSCPNQHEGKSSTGLIRDKPPVVPNIEESINGIRSQRLTEIADVMRERQRVSNEIQRCILTCVPPEIEPPSAKKLTPVKLSSQNELDDSVELQAGQCGYCNQVDPHRFEEDNPGSSRGISPPPADDGSHKPFLAGF